MSTIPNSGYGVCYLDAAGRRVSLNDPEPADAVIQTGEPPRVASRAIGWIAWGRSAFALTIVLLLIGLGAANVAMYSRWHEVEDGVLWGERSEGVTALEVVPDSAAARAGLERGDVLLAVNGSPVESPADVLEYQHRS